MKAWSLLLILLIVIGSNIQAQESTKWSVKDHITIDGYIKYLPTVSFSGVDDLLTNNLIHNRINITAYWNEAFTTKISIRNRIIYGELVKYVPNYAQQIAIDNGTVNLSKLWIGKKSILAHTIIDRAYMDYANAKWQVTLGRQRINWGINLAWNTNDLFNAYNIIDFDYEERAGTDALRVQYYGEKSTTELAYHPGKDLDHSVIATRYKFNQWKYDIQIIAANYYTDLVIGAGWAGNIKNAGFKGEISYFKDKKKSEQATSISTSVDYFFKKGLYLNVSTLYTSNGETSYNPSILKFTSSSLSAKKLMPTKLSSLVQLSYTFNPQLSTSITTIYGYGINLLFVMPSIDYSIVENWDLNLTGQVFYVEDNTSFKNLSNSIFLRLRYSY